MNFSEPMISRKMMTKILCGNFDKSFLEYGKERFKIDLPALPARTSRSSRSGSCNSNFSKTHSCKLIPNVCLPILITVIKFKVHLTPKNEI